MTAAWTQRASSFGGVAEFYDRYRPAAPAAAVEWILPTPCPVGLDLGAGTGALTRRLMARTGRVLAVEPDPRMLAVLVDRSPGALGVQAVAEHLPLADGLVDVVTVSSAWHWMDTVATVDEIGRILSPGGVLGIVWNGPDRSVPWVGDLLEGQDRPAAEGEARRSRHQVELPPEAPFEQLTTCLIDWTLTLTGEELIGLSGTYSRFITLPEDEQAAEIARAEERAAASPLLAEGSTIDLPMTCRCWRAVRV